MVTQPMMPPTLFKSTAAIAAVEGPDDVALAYVEAYRTERCSVVVATTWWMQERLAYEAAQGKERQAVQDDLCGSVFRRYPAENLLTAWGIEDQYVFRPGSEIEYIGSDLGRDDLEKPVRKRCWFRVTYPSAYGSPADEEGRPIESLTVGVNVSNDGHVLKANIIGNLDIADETRRFSANGGT